MTTYAEFITFALGNIQRLALAISGVDAVSLSTRSTIVAGSNNFIIVDNYGAISATQTSAASSNSFRC